MKIFKFILLWISMSVVMIITWSIGSILGNVITQTSPPVVDDPAAVGFIVLIVCVANSLLWSALFWSTRSFTGLNRPIAILAYLFGTEFFLTQMETFFFSESLGISIGQINSILISGLIMVTATGSFGLWLTKKLSPIQPGVSFKLEVPSLQTIMGPVLLLSLIAYPLIYETFGYYVAWQNEHLRQYYSGSSELKSFTTQLESFFIDGIYFFQVLRAVIWIIISIPIVLLLRENKIAQYALVAFLSALPAVQLFIPNPYMPAEIAMTHFVETFPSNFLWGLLIVYMTRRTLAT